MVFVQMPEYSGVILQTPAKTYFRRMIRTQASEIEKNFIYCVYKFENNIVFLSSFSGAFSC